MQGNVFGRVVFFPPSIFKSLKTISANLANFAFKLKKFTKFSKPQNRKKNSLMQHHSIFSFKCHFIFQKSTPCCHHFVVSWNA
jgi:hypothetical protein